MSTTFIIENSDKVDYLEFPQTSDQQGEQFSASEQRENCLGGDQGDHQITLPHPTKEVVTSGEATKIYKELYRIAHDSHVNVTVGYGEGLAAFRSGSIESLGVSFHNASLNPELVKDYTSQSFTREEIEDGIVEIQERLRRQPDAEGTERRSRMNDILFHLSPQGIKAIRRTAYNTGETTTLTPLQMNMVNVVSYVTLAPDRIKELFGSYNNFVAALRREKAITADESEDLSLIETATLVRRPIFNHGLSGYIYFLDQNRNGAQDKLSSFRKYIEKSQARLMTPQNQISAPEII